MLEEKQIKREQEQHALEKWTAGMTKKADREKAEKLAFKQKKKRIVMQRAQAKVAKKGKL